MHTFEHDPECHERLLPLIERYGLNNLTVHHAPIRSYSHFDWYDLPRGFDAEAFNLVICDGPSRHLTDSGRYGLFLRRDRRYPGWLWGPISPIGGLCLIVGWVWLLIVAWKL